MQDTPTTASGSTRKRFLLCMAVLLAIAVSVPAEWMTAAHLDREVLIAALGMMLFLALFLYVRLFFFLLLMALVVGANLPDQVAATLGISTMPMLIALVVMVTASLLNSMTLTIPTGTGVRQRKANALALDSLMKAIDKRRLPGVQALLEMEFDLDQFGANGLTPLMLAAQLGETRIVAALLDAGARRDIVGPQGTAADIAARVGQSALAEQLQPSVTATSASNTEAVA